MRSGRRLLLDTAYIQALLSRRDAYHEAALRLLPEVASAHEVLLTEAVLIESANALSRINRQGFAEFVRAAYEEPNIRIVAVDSALLRRGLELYELRADKTWSLTDCLSFVVMENEGVTDAATTDHHFEQAGFRALMVESPQPTP